MYGLQTMLDALGLYGTMYKVTEEGILFWGKYGFLHIMQGLDLDKKTK